LKVIIWLVEIGDQ